MTRDCRAPLTVLFALAVGSAQAAETRCDVLLNVADKDPAGLNVRAAPGGPVIGALKARTDWVRVHVTGQAGDWMRIDGATLYSDDLPRGEKVVFKGAGYVALRKLEIETLNPGAVLRALPSDAGKAVFKAPMGDDKAPKAQVIGCDGRFLNLRIGGVTGWTRDVCTNQRTTCS